MVDNANNVMTLDYTLHHHISGVNAVALSPDGDRLLSGGDDADIVVWNILTGEKVQVIRCAFHGPIGALVWIPELPGLAPGFAFGCADGSIHVYQRVETSSDYQYFTQDLVHDGPVIDLKFDAQFGRLASVGNGFAQVSQLQTTDGKLLQPMVSSPTSSRYTATSIHFRDEGASVLVCTLETHKIECYSIEPWTLKWSKQIRTRIAYADLNKNYLAITNLHDGIDLYSVPSMQLIKTYPHGNANTTILKVSFVDRSWLVSGGQDGYARLYDVKSGQLIQKLEHGSGDLVQTVTSHTQLETTTIITATAVIKVWSRNRNSQDKQSQQPPMPGSLANGHPPPSGVSLSQLLTLLLLTTMLNFFMTHSDSFTQVVNFLPSYFFRWW